LPVGCTGYGIDSHRRPERSSNNGIVVVGNDIHPGFDRVGSRSGWDTDPIVLIPWLKVHDKACLTESVAI
jgi:hypothetical protein